MITLNQIADLMIHDLSGGIMSKDEAIKLDRRDIAMKVRSYLVPLLKGEYFSHLNEGSRSANTSIIATYELNLQTESGTGQKYLTIPEFYMSLPHNKGIHRIFVKGGHFNDITIMKNPGISGALPHTKIKGEVFMYVEGMKIKAGPGFNMSSANKFILQLLVPAPDTLADTDPLPILAEHVDDILTMLKKDYAPLAQVPVDTLNNQNPNIR